MLHIVLHRLAVGTAVFHSDHRSLCCRQCCLDGNTFSADHAEIILCIHHHFIENDSADLASHIMNRTLLEHFISHTDFRRIAGVRIDNEHSGGSIDSAVDHILYFTVQNLAFRFGTLIIPDIAFSKTGIPKSIKNIIYARIGKHQSRLVCLHGRDHIFILFRDIYHLNMFKVNRRILGIILQPRQDYLVTKKRFLHKPFPPFLLILLLYLKPHDKTTAFIIS